MKGFPERFSFPNFPEKYFNLKGFPGIMTLDKEKINMDYFKRKSPKVQDQDQDQDQDLKEEILTKELEAMTPEERKKIREKAESMLESISGQFVDLIGNAENQERERQLEIETAEEQRRLIFDQLSLVQADLNRIKAHLGIKDEPKKQTPYRSGPGPLDGLRR